MSKAPRLKPEDVRAAMEKMDRERDREAAMFEINNAMDWLNVLVPLSKKHAAKLTAGNYPLREQRTARRMARGIAEVQRVMSRLCPTTGDLTFPGPCDIKQN